MTTSNFESAILQQLDAAHNLARWLVRNDQDAQDVVQDSCIKALKAFHSFRGDDFRPWFLAIVRNTSFSWLSRAGNAKGMESLDTEADLTADQNMFDPQAIAVRAADAAQVRNAIANLPETWREVIVLREMEGLSYREIGKIVGVPIGTVMSRLSRGRSKLQLLLMNVEAT